MFYENNIIICLKKKFLSIKNKGWIKSSFNGWGDCGLTFEKELGLFKNELEIPDFMGIEIKTKNAFKRPYLSLFSSNFDGKYLFNIDDFVTKYGWPDEKIKTSNVFYLIANAKTFVETPSEFKFKLTVNYNLQQVFLEISEKNNYNITSLYSWSFDILKEKIDRKLKYMAFVEAKRKLENGSIYFWYDKLSLYCCKNFDTFLSLIENNIITVRFNIGLYTDEKRYGKIHNHGISFQILVKNLNLLFDSMSF